MKRSRRSLLSLGLLTGVGALVLPQDRRAPQSASPTHWLEGKLREGCAWIRLGEGPDGVAELHCGCGDPASFTERLLPLADPEHRVLADGNALHLMARGSQLRVVLYFLPAIV